MNEDEALKCLDIASAAIRVEDWSKVYIKEFFLIFPFLGGAIYR
jgi:hypothetical protein